MSTVSLFRPISQITPHLVTQEDLPSANALNELIQHFSTLLGPILSEGTRSDIVVIEESTAPATLRKGVQGVVEDIREGLSYVMSSTWVW
ncbi:MAG: hypothetical protein PVS3B3_31450 [Ktedonobacteraceae bacterium]